MVQNPIKPSRVCSCGGTKARASSARCDQCARTARRVVRPPCACGCGASVAKARAIYASNECQGNVAYREWVERWLRGEEDGVSGGVATSAHIRRWLKDTKGWECEDCGWCRVHPVTGFVPLTVHHLDGDALNNRPNNLQILCPNCHSLTDTYKILNKGKGRTRRVTLSKRGILIVTSAPLA